jgi:hypothetical protein
MGQHLGWLWSLPAANALAKVKDFTLATTDAKCDSLRVRGASAVLAAMKRAWLVFALVLLLVTGLAVPAASAASPPPTSTWHRLNPDQNNPAPEHERLRCIEAAV